MSTIKVNTITDANGGSNVVLQGVASPPNGMGFRNRIINGDMRIDQRNAGASVTVNSSTELYPVDRFVVIGQSSDGVFTAQRDTVVPIGTFVNSIKVTVTTADTSIGASQFYLLQQRIEGFNTADFGWGTASAQTVTLSFWVRSSLTGTFGGSLRNATVARSYPFSYTISGANTWEYKTVTIDDDTSGTWVTDNGIGIIVTFSLGDGSSRLGTAGAWAAGNFSGATGQTNLIGTNGATFYITGVQLEVGSVDSPFERRDIGRELMMCQRYYYRQTVTTSNQAFGMGQCFSTTAAYGVIPYPVSMRIAPTALEQSGTAGDYRITTSGFGAVNCSSVATHNIATTWQGTVIFTAASGLVAGNATSLQSTASTAFLGWSAEL